MRDISGAAVPAHSWTAWPYDPKEWFATHQRSILWKGETCSYYHGQCSEHAPPDVAVIILDLLLPGLPCLLRFVNCHLVILEVMLSMPLSGPTVMATELKAGPLARERLQAKWLALQVVST